MFLLSGSGFLSRCCSRLSECRLLKEGTRNTERHEAGGNASTMSTLLVEENINSLDSLVRV